MACGFYSRRSHAKSRKLDGDFSLSEISHLPDHHVALLKFSCRKLKCFVKAPWKSV